MSYLNTEPIILTEDYSFTNISDNDYSCKFCSEIFDTGYYFEIPYILDANVLNSISKKYSDEFINDAWPHIEYDKIKESKVIGHITFLSNFETHYLNKTKDRLFHVYICGTYKENETELKKIYRQFFETHDYNTAINIIKDLTSAITEIDLEELNKLKEFLENSTTITEEYKQEMLSNLQNKLYDNN